MEDERRQRLLLPGQHPVPTRQAPPPPQPAFAPPQPVYFPQSSYSTQSSYLQQSSNSSHFSGSSVPSVIIEKHPHQVVLVQRGSEGCCSRKKRWSRMNGFLLGGGILLVGATFLAVQIYDANSKQSKTENFKEGICKTHDTVPLAISTQSFTCEKPDCKGSCEQTFGCKQVIGKIQYDNKNHSELLQIYASYEDIQRHEGECSYRPASECKEDTEKFFRSSEALDKKEYKCFYSEYEPRMVILKKNSRDIDFKILSIPVVFILVGISFILCVKFCGHKCGCQPYSLIKKQQEMQLQEAHQLWPMVSTTSSYGRK